MSSTTSEKILADSTLSNALDQVLSRQLELQAEINGIRPASAERKQDYDAAIAEFTSIRGGALFFPYLATGAGNGLFVVLAVGSVKYDLTCVTGVHIMGHGHPAVLKASLRAGLEDVTMQGNHQQTVTRMPLRPKQLQLAQRQARHKHAP